jgi:hypothetical protein
MPDPFALPDRVDVNGDGIELVFRDEVPVIQLSFGYAGMPDVRVMIPLESARVFGRELHRFADNAIFLLEESERMRRELIEGAADA